jgi:long-chain acyl-CoA synthetase
VSVLVAVPKLLDVLREHILRIAPETGEPDALAGRRWWWRWWRYRRIHRLFGWKFWAIVVGAAPLGAESEAFWRKLGFVIVQGYGLTEAAPIVTLNHPFHASAGTVGVPIPGVEVRIEPDGEILVRGENVTSGYYSANGEAAASPGATAVVDAAGWLHTGDVGAIDSGGRLTIKGRKKEMIVTAQGLNVFPEDVERALLGQPGVTDAAVVGLRAGGEERIHAVLILDSGVDLDATIRTANATLEDHQRVWRAVVWPGAELPRTEGTRKVRRLELRRWLEAMKVPVSQGSRVADIVARFSAGRALTSDTTLDELGLSSLDRVELSIALERAFETTIDESALASVRTVGDLEKLASKPGQLAGARPGEEVRFPKWNHLRIWRVARRVSLPTWILPLAHIFMKVEVRGLEHLRDLTSPVVFAVNHQSHMDVPAVLIALPARWRYRVAPAMAREFFDAHFHRRQHGWWAWWTNTLNYVLSSLFFNAFPFPQREAGARPTLRYIGEVSARGDSILIFPEGRRTSTGAIGSFRPGVALIASRLDLRVVPVRLDGLDKVLHRSMGFPKRGPVRVTFGQALTLTGDDYPAMARVVEEAVRAL